MSDKALLDTLADEVRPGAGGSPELVPLDPDHPGFRDPVYRARRNAIAKLAFDYITGDPAPIVTYTDEEHAVWKHVRELLDPRHRDFACAEYLECVDAVALDRIAAALVDEAAPEMVDQKSGRWRAPAAGIAHAVTPFVPMAGRTAGNRPGRRPPSRTRPAFRSPFFR